VELAIVITIFTLVVFGAIEVSRAVFEKHTLARAAEVIVQELADTDPENGLAITNTWTLATTDMSKAISDTNRQAGLNLSTIWPTSPYTDVVDLPNGKFNPADSACDLTPGPTDNTCQSAPNSDGSVVVTGYPDLVNPSTITVKVSQPYRSFLEYPLQLLGGNASETVSGSTLTDQQVQS
jgi:Flp pilus assembly protein TadG